MQYWLNEVLIIGYNYHKKGSETLIMLWNLLSKDWYG